MKLATKEHQPANQITITLPESVPAPKFQLFQRVYCKTRNRQCVITGMRLINLFTALVNRYEDPGWFYEVHYYFDAPIEESLRVAEDESTEVGMTEDELQSLNEV